MFYIKLTKKDGSIESIKVHKEVTTIGGDFKSHIRCEAKDLEGIQLRVMLAPGFSFKVKDLNNSGKVFHKNAILEQETTLKSNEKLKIGSTEIFFVYPRDEETTGRKFKDDPVHARIETLKDEVSFIEPIDTRSYNFSTYQKLFQKIAKRAKDANSSLHKISAEDFDKLVSLEGEKNQELLNDLKNEFVAYGPITPLLADNEISEIIINGLETLYIEKKGKLIQCNKRFASVTSLMLAIDRLLAQSGIVRSKDTQLIDARLSDG